MLEQITWSQYGTTIGVTTAIYYAGIGILFYRKKILIAFNRTSLHTHNYPSAPPNNIMGAIASDPTICEGQISAEGLVGDSSEDPNEPSLEETPENICILDKTTETGDMIHDALSELGVNTNAQQIITSISAIIKKQNVDGTLIPFREALDWHINQTALDSCGISIDKEDLDTIWNTP